MYVGKPLRRREDERFLTGRGRFVDDLALPGMAHLVFVRSRHAHALIRSLSCERANRMPGVLRIVTAAEWAAAGHGELDPGHSVPFSDGRPMNNAPRPAFAAAKVCHIGDVVAAVVASSYHEAMDAAEAVDVDYEPLPAVLDARAAAESTTLVHGAFGANVATEIIRGDRKATAAAFARAAHVTSLSLAINRVGAMPLETQSYVADHDPATGETVLWATSQMPHRLRQWLCHYTLHIPQHKLRVISPDVGGGFGLKGNFIPEASTVVWMARALNRAVKWTATRSEAMLTDTQGRDHDTVARMAFDERGIILGVDVDTVAALGAYASSSGPGIPGVSYPQTITGLYRTPNLSMRIRCVYTNTLPVAAYRGSGRPEATFVNERLLENGAREMGIDVVEMRRRNLIEAREFPYRTPAGRTYDCGNPPLMLDKLTALSRYAELRREQAELRKGGILLGIGLPPFWTNPAPGRAASSTTMAESRRATNRRPAACTATAK
jgi:aerobic carbon-monoxide dehydrogenase large subunit